MNDIFVYCIDLPAGINEVVTPCLDGYTIYIADALSPQGKKEALEHALNHIQNDDWNKSNVQEIENGIR